MSEYNRGDRLLVRSEYGTCTTIRYLNYSERDSDYFIGEYEDGDITDEWRFDEIVRVLANAKQFKWTLDFYNGLISMKCPYCGALYNGFTVASGIPRWKHCPECGTKMSGAVKNDEK